MSDDIGLLEKIAYAVRPVHFELFCSKRNQHGRQRDITRNVGGKGDLSYAFRVDGKTFLVVEVKGLPVHKEADKTDTPLGEVLLEGTINNTSWFELCRLSRDGVYNLAAITAAQATRAAGDTQSVLHGASRISLFKIRGSITKLPKDADPVSVVVFGVN